MENINISRHVEILSIFSIVWRRKEHFCLPAKAGFRHKQVWLSLCSGDGIVVRGGWWWHHWAFGKEDNIVYLVLVLGPSGHTLSSSLALLRKKKFFFLQMFPIKKLFVFFLSEFLESFDDIARPPLSPSLSFSSSVPHTYTHTRMNTHTTVLSLRTF